MKRCCRCNETKEEEEFYRNVSMPDGLQKWCKSCLYPKPAVYNNNDRIIGRYGPGFIVEYLEAKTYDGLSAYLVQFDCHLATKTQRGLPPYIIFDGEFSFV